jgi:hypothetical protein
LFPELAALLEGRFEEIAIRVAGSTRYAELGSVGKKMSSPDWR